MDRPKWAEEIEAGARYENLKPLLLRKQIRYWLSRLRSEALEDKEKPDLPKGFKKFFSDQEYWDGWENWGITWDVGTPMRQPDPDNAEYWSDDPLEVVPRFVSIEEEWEETIDAHVKADTISARKRQRRQQMEEANGSEDNV